MKVYIKQWPRSLVVAGETHALVTRVMTSDDGDKKRSCYVEISPLSELDMHGHVAQPAKCLGILGIIDMGPDAFLVTITDRSDEGSPMPGRSISRILGVEFYCLNRPYNQFLDPNSMSAEQINIQRQDKKYEEHPCTGIHKLLIGGSFYYSTDFDLTSTLQNVPLNTPMSSTPFDESFMWNSYMMSELSKFRGRLPNSERDVLDKEGFLCCAIHGFAKTVDISLSHDLGGRLSVISRQSWKRAGTRYNARGIDDDGNVANFVETETILWLDNGQQFGYVQLRGSVPCFWEQDANLLGAKMNFSRSFEGSQRAFNKHFEHIVERFGAVHCLDLLSTRTGELDLSKRYRAHLNDIDKAMGQSVKYTHFDFHKEVSGSQGYAAASRIIEKVQDSMLEFGFFSYNPTTSQSETEQIGIFRTNCMDCLDRTNLVQQLVSRDALDLFLDYYNYPTNDGIWDAHSTLWADNGDQLSMIYAGTNALKSSYTRSGKMNIAGALSDVTKSVSRLYVNNFVDKTRQSQIEFLLGRGPGQVLVTIYDPINDWVQEQLKWRTREFSSPHEIQIFAGTFNINGKSPNVDLTPWLFPPEMQQFPDLYMICLQEMVELTAGQIISADQTRKVAWEEGILQCLNRREPYVLMRSGQLVGTTIMLFVKKTEINHITMVEGTSKKTAFGGITGNKGGVAVSFMYANTSICFVNSHFAAGQNNVEERHHDYKSLYTGIRFSRGRHVTDHELIVWGGDFNFRLELPNDTVRKMLHLHLNADENNPVEGMIPGLLEYDQLNSQMQKGETFPYFKEGDITFLPTYKYDPGTNKFDTSEKARTPSYTDRILSRGTSINQLAYNSAPTIKFSDHRPVYALYEATVMIVNKAKRMNLYNEIYQRRRDQIGGANYMVNEEKFAPAHPQKVTDIGYPPPSTDAKKWWQEGGKPTKVPIQPPHQGQVLNPQKVNPFSADTRKLDNFVEASQAHLEPRPPVPRRPSTMSTMSATPSVKSVAPSVRSAAPSVAPSAAPSAAPSVKSQRSAAPSLLDDSEHIPYKSLI